jgi:SAM-dependent methyltransferase
MMTMGELLTGAWVAQGIATVARLGVADHIDGEAVAVGDLARAVGADEDALYRVLRMLAPAGVFRELRGKRFALTEVGRLLRRDHPDSMRAFAAYNGEPWHWGVWGQLEGSVRSGRPAQADGLLPLFEYLAEHPEASDAFDAAMADLSNARDVSAISGYDFGQFKTVVDVGGGEGRLVRSVLREFPDVSGVLYDLPLVIERARSRIEAEGLANRCALVAGSFFDHVPSGGDACVLKQVLHDWQDDKAVNILANCREALVPGGKVLIIEMVVPESDEASVAKLSDIEMLVVTGGRERTLREYESLLERAGLRYLRAYETRSPFTIIEATPADSRPDAAAQRGFGKNTPGAGRTA